jgi:hypothetical protein
MLAAPSCPLPPVPSPLHAIIEPFPLWLLLALHLLIHMSAITRESSLMLPCCMLMQIRLAGNQFGMGGCESLSACMINIEFLFQMYW